MHPVLCRHDISSSEVDPKVKAILEATIAENDVDRHVSNLMVFLADKILIIHYCFPISRVFLFLHELDLQTALSIHTLSGECIAC